VKQSKCYARENRTCAGYVRNILQTMNTNRQTLVDWPRKPLRARGEYETALTDLLAHIRHFCDAKGLDFGNVDETAYGHYTAEVVKARRGVER
jgi:hypothetical protein